MSASIALQKDVSIAYLGPPGTFSHQAAYKRLGDSVAYVPQTQIDGNKLEYFIDVKKKLLTFFFLCVQMYLQLLKRGKQHTVLCLTKIQLSDRLLKL